MNFKKSNKSGEVALFRPQRRMENPATTTRNFRNAPAGHPAAVRHSRSDPNTVKVRLTTADVAALKRIADTRGLQPEDIARDILQNF